MRPPSPRYCTRSEDTAGTRPTCPQTAKHTAQTTRRKARATNEEKGQSAAEGTSAGASVSDGQSSEAPAFPPTSAETDDLGTTSSSTPSDFVPITTEPANDNPQPDGAEQSSNDDNPPAAELPATDTDYPCRREHPIRSAVGSIAMHALKRGRSKFLLRRSRSISASSCVVWRETGCIALWISGSTTIQVAPGDIARRLEAANDGGSRKDCGELSDLR